jgi:NAD(P)-dependent dehydrogenase (short-subunit alcohol dehydrogenase family)
MPQQGATHVRVEDVFVVAERFVQCDVEKPLDIEQMVGRVLELFGRLDIAFNNAGILVRVRVTASAIRAR